MLDKVFAAIGMLGVIAFMGVVTVFVMEPDLWVVTIVVIGIGIAYFVNELRAGGSHIEGDDDSNA
jgi:hypothetical protein